MLLRAADDRRRGAPRLRSARPEVPAALEAVVARCLEPDPDDRYASAADLAADLQAVADDRPLRHASEPWPARTARWARRNRRFLATAVPVLLAVTVIAGVVVRERLLREQLLTKARRLFDEGAASEAAGDFARAAVQFESVARLIDQPEPATGDQPSAGPGALFGSPESLRQQARHRFKLAERIARFRADADALFAAGESLRFRLAGFGGDPDAAAHELLRRLRPFRVFSAADWLERPDLKLLDDARRERLIAEADELLFLWAAVALDHEGDPASLGRAAEVCDRALTFTRSQGPWLALKSRLAERYGPPAASSSLPRGEPTPLGEFEWGVLLLQEGRFGEAVAQLRSAARGDEGNYWYQYYLAFAHDEKGRGDADRNEALRHYEVALALKPQSPWVRFSLARLYRQRGVWAQARAGLLQAIEDDEALPAADRDPVLVGKARLELGLVLQAVGDLGGARDEYDRVISADPSGDLARAARLNRAKLDADSGDFAAARAAYDAALSDPAAPDQQTARLTRALLSLRSGDAARAEADLSALLDASGLAGAARSEVLAYRAEARLAQRRAGAAAADADEAYRLRPGPRTDRLRTRARIAQGRAEGLHVARPEDLASLPYNGPPLRDDLRALTAPLRRLAATPRRPDDPDAQEARLTLAVVLAALGDPAADSEATRAVAASALSVRPYLTRARVRRFAGRLAAAREDAEKAVALEPDDPRAWALRGQLRAESGDPKGGLADLGIASTLGDDRTARAPRAAALMAAGDALGAAREWSAALAVDPDDASAYLGRAEAFLALDQWDQAVADLEQSLAWADGRPDLAARIILTYARCLPRRPSQVPRFFAVVRAALLPHSAAVDRSS
jgi:tetratricopeptide (TPR) repeat protein